MGRSGPTGARRQHPLTRTPSNGPAGLLSGRSGLRANIVMPCLLLEVGRRKKHIQVEFPSDPTDSSVRFKLRAGESYPVHSINNEQLVHQLLVVDGMRSEERRVGKECR